MNFEVFIKFEFNISLSLTTLTNLIEKMRYQSKSVVELILF